MEIDGLEVVKRNGNNEKMIFFIHGSSGGAWCWEEHFSLFFNSYGYATCSFSMRGNGCSWGKDRFNKWGIDDYVQDCMQVLKSIDRKPIIIAHSVGCSILMRILSQYQDIAEKVIFLAPMPYNGVWAEYCRIGFSSLRYHDSLDMYFGNRLAKEKVERYKEKCSPVSTRVSRQLLVPILLNKTFYKMNSLVIGSTSDLMVSKVAVYKVGKKFNSKIIMFPEMCHMLMLDPEWGKVADEIRRYIEC